MSETNRLYGLPHAEDMCLDPAEVYERWFDDNEFDGWVRPESLIIEEWTAVPLGDKLPTAEYITERMAEDAADDAGYSDAWVTAGAAAKDPEVVAAFESARAVMASKMTSWLCAEKQLENMIITWDENNEPLLNGKPLYTKVAET